MLPQRAPAHVDVGNAHCIGVSRLPILVLAGAKARNVYSVYKRSDLKVRINWENHLNWKNNSSTVVKVEDHD